MYWNILFPCLFRSIDGSPKSIVKWQRIHAVATMNSDTIVGCGMRTADLRSRTCAQSVVPRADVDVTAVRRWVRRINL